MEEKSCNNCGHWNGFINWQQSQLSTAKEEVVKLIGEISRYRKALDFYANTNPVCTCIVDGNYTEQYQDNGEIAKEALSHPAPIDEEKEHLKEKLIDKEKHIEALKEVLNEFVPIEHLDEANNMVIELAKGIEEKACRDLLNQARSRIEAEGEKK
jgi:hypothetical protein